MFRGYRLLGITALISFVGLSGYQSSYAQSGKPSPKQDANPSDNTPTQIAPAIDRVAKELAETRKDQSEPYGDERNQREKRDLIAQEDSAYWAGWNFIAMILQTCLAGGALVALVCDLKQNRKTAQAQLRPYVYTSYVDLIFSEDVGIDGLPKDWATVAIGIKNFGSTPAIKARATMTREIWEFPIPENHKPLTLQNFAGDVSDMPPNCESDNRLDFDISDNQRKLIIEGNAAVYAMGRIEYWDTFGKPHNTNFFMFSSGQDFITGEFRNCPKGNDAT